MHEVVAELLNVDGRTVRYDEANSYYPEILRMSLKIPAVCLKRTE